MKNVIILALENTLSSTVTGPLDIFGQAGVLWNGITGEPVEPFFSVRIASLDGQPVRCHGGLVIEPHLAMDEVDLVDLIIISQEDVSTLETTSRFTTPWLQKWSEKGAWIASICTGAFILAESGLLTNRRATTHWGFAETFRQRYPQVDLRQECMITEDSGLFCSGGAHSYFDLCLYLIEKMLGYEMAVRSAKSLLLDLSRGSQTDYSVFEFQKKHRDEAVLKVQEWVEKHYAEDLKIDVLAGQAGMSPRNFKRRFKNATGDTPLVYIQRYRIEVAKRLMENRHLGIEEIGSRVGYDDARFFRRLFRRHTGSSPVAYRHRLSSRN